MGGRARIGLLVAALLALLGVVQPIGSPVAPHGPVVAASVSTGQAWQDSLHTFRDQPRRLVAERHAPSASDTWWVLYEQATGACPPHRRARAGEAGDSRLACAAPPPRSSRAPPAEMS